MDKCCGTCRYAQDEAKGWLGCHRYPPSVPIVGSRYETDGRYMTELGVVYTGYPIVDDAEWCGEWKPARKGRK